MTNDTIKQAVAAIRAGAKQWITDAGATAQDDGTVEWYGDAEAQAEYQRLINLASALEAEATPAPAAHIDSDAVDHFAAHLQRQRDFSERTFGPGQRTKGVCDHIRKELLEVESSPEDLTEWIDVVILALDGAWRTGASPAQIIDAIVAKQAVNEGRHWPDWRTMDPNKAIEHARLGEAAPQPAVQAAPAASAEPVAWLVDWPDEPELGHYLAEAPADIDSGRSRALVFRDAAHAPQNDLFAQIQAAKVEVAAWPAERRDAVVLQGPLEKGETVQTADTSYEGGSNPPNRTLYLLTSKHGLNMVAGDDMRQLLDFGRSCWQAGAAQAPAANEDALDAALEAVRTRLCKIQRYSFLIDARGNLRRTADRSGNWIEFDAAHKLFDPVVMDAAIAADSPLRKGGEG